ncbi:MAG: T9SS type A sorting domain-containing protein [Saprospiraceae bacterium]|nr:T9SS type A sorting domain-containing protein [Saprospiraceae bacterium]
MKIASARRLSIGILTILLLGTIGLTQTFSQIDTVILEESASLQFPPLLFKSSLACRLDRQNPDFAYSANMHHGLGIYDLSTTGTIIPVLDLPIDSFNGLDVSTLQQIGNLLYVGIGDFQTKDNPATGLAILDISMPNQPTLVGIWDSTFFTKGVSHLMVKEDLAYLSIMADGLLILDVSEPEHIQFVSHFLPDITYPAPSTDDHQSRGLKIRNDSLFLAFDRGGLRILDISDPYAPAEIGKYINLDLNSSAGAAYNDVVIKDNFAICSVDYCGLEVIDLSTTPMTSDYWYNPWGCSWLNWSGADLHLNELHFARNDSLLVVSAGQSEVLIFDISNPEIPQVVGHYGTPSDTMATYGVDVSEDRVLLSYINTPFHIPPFTPFYSNYGGLKLLQFQTGTSAVEPVDPSIDLQIAPNPFSDVIHITHSQPIESLTILDLFGRELLSADRLPPGEHTFHTDTWPSGILYVQIMIGQNMTSRMIIKQ